MGKNRLKDASLYSVLREDLGETDFGPGFGPDENEVRQALLKRPSFTVKIRLILVFLILFLISAGISIAAMLMLTEIEDRMELVTMADRFANEIQHSRRIEKNFFLYGSDLSEVLPHLVNAKEILNTASQELGDVVGLEEINSIHEHLEAYSQLSNVLINNSQDPGFKTSEEFARTSQELRDNGSIMLALSLDLSKKERQVISSTTSQARRTHIFLLAVLLLLLVFIAAHIYRHIILRLNRLLEATQHLARGDFLPITPQRKYKDEFSHLVIALNHTMYELDRRQNLLVESHKLRAIGNLTAGVAHELNNPLNNIILTAEVLKDSYKDLPEEELQDIAHDLVTQGERAQGVVKNLLDFARESETKTEYLHIETLIDETTQLAKNQIKLSKVELEEDIDKDLPPIHGDRELLKQVFLNLFINALDAMPGGGKLSVRVTEEKNTGFLSIRITDTGEGIPGHIMGSIFNPFFSTKPTSKGTGLGLAVSRGIVERHGGKIEVESILHEGATFIVHLPIVPIPADIMDKRPGE